MYYSQYVSNRPTEYLQEVCQILEMATNDIRWSLLDGIATIFFIKLERINSCKDDHQNQWKRTKFDIRPTLNP